MVIVYYENIGSERGLKMKNRKEQRNIEIEDSIWRKVGSLAAEMGVTKKELVKQALNHFIFQMNKSK